MSRRFYKKQHNEGFVSNLDGTTNSKSIVFSWSTGRINLEFYEVVLQLWR